MDTIKTVAAMQQTRCHMPEPVGLVPTMGFLHEGHLSLVRKAKAENASVVVSIFVNPTQFGPAEDLQCYPRDIPRDLALLAKEGIDAVFVPESADMYPPGFDTWVVLDKITERLEGAVRPGHFRGVATVCCKLFNIVRPGRAYFGQKDAQQALVIKRMVADLNMKLEVITLPTIREPDGLAISSRNVYLNADERRAATVLFRSLRMAEAMWHKGELDAGVIRRAMKNQINGEPMAKIDYISIADSETLVELENIKVPVLISMAVKIGKTRLIDNVVLA